MREPLLTLVRMAGAARRRQRAARGKVTESIDPESGMLSVKDTPGLLDLLEKMPKRQGGNK